MPSRSREHASRHSQEGTLYLVGTPIGNLADITLRAVDTLKSVPRIAAEDTRRTRALLSHLGISRKTLHCVSANTAQHTLDRLLAALKSGDDLALVTDAGMPTISDPGARLVQGAVEQGLSIVCIPGPSAVTTAAALSGLIQGAFLFLGFLPRKGKKRKQELARIAAAPEPVVLFESPLRTKKTLDDLAELMPNRPAVLCRELTKVHEQVLRGTLAELASSSVPARGEVTLVVEGLQQGVFAAADLTGPALDREIRQLSASGNSTKDIVQQLLERASLPRQALYALVQAVRDREADREAND